MHPHIKEEAFDLGLPRGAVSDSALQLLWEGVSLLTSLCHLHCADCRGRTASLPLCRVQSMRWVLGQYRTRVLGCLCVCVVCVCSIMPCTLPLLTCLQACRHFREGFNSCLRGPGCPILTLIAEFLYCPTEG